MNLRTALEILGVAAGAADQATIKAAYRAKLLDAHPDKGGNAEYFSRVKSAGEVAVKKTRKRGRPAKKRNGPAPAGNKSEREERRKASKHVYYKRRVDGHIARERRAAAAEKKKKTAAAMPPPKPAAAAAPNPWAGRVRPEPTAALNSATWDLRTKAPPGANGSPVKPPREPSKRDDTVRMWAAGAVESLAAGEPIPSAHEGVCKPTRKEWEHPNPQTRGYPSSRELDEQEAQAAGLSLEDFEYERYKAQYGDDYDWPFSDWKAMGI